MTWDELKRLAVKREARTMDAQSVKCGDKKAYPSRTAANHAFTWYRKNNKNWVAQVPYRCDICKKWHLTKKRR